jgi:hypothetical protein
MPSLIDRLQLTQSLDFKSSWLLQECVDNLWELDYRRSRIMGGGGIEVNLYEVAPERYRVDIRMTRRNRSWSLTTVHLNGFLMTTADGKTNFSGEIALSDFYIGYAVLLIGVPTLIMAASKNPQNALLGLVLVVVGLIVVTGLLRSDYQTLLERFKYAISD